MTKGFDIAVAWLQLLLLALWEGLGAVYFGWSPLAIFLCWIVGVWTINIVTATVLRTFIKLTTPPEPVDNVVNLHAVTEEDGVA